MKDYFMVYIIEKIDIFDLAPPPSSGCFPSFGKVSIESGKSVQISELQIGNKVKAGRNLKEVFQSV